MRLRIAYNEDGHFGHFTHPFYSDSLRSLIPPLSLSRRALSILSNVGLLGNVSNVGRVLGRVCPPRPRSLLGLDPTVGALLFEQGC